MFDRSKSKIIRGLLSGRQWFGMIRIFTLLKRPLHFMRIYLFFQTVRLRESDHLIRYKTITGESFLEVLGPHDYLTFFEVYCRRDYSLSPDSRLVIDIGSNIGITSRYFLEHSLNSFVVCYEPLPQNLEILAKNLSGFEDRSLIVKNACDVSSGTKSLYTENTGRYGSLVQNGLHEDSISVHAEAFPEVIELLISKFAQIDYLKIDTEGTEIELINSLSQSQLSRIHRIQFENNVTGISTIEI